MFKPRTLKDMMRCESGNVIILLGLAALLLVLSVGVAVDMAREQILQQRISSALDAAGLAAAQTVDNPPNGLTSDAWAELEAERYFNANFQTGYLDSHNINCCNVVLSNGTETLDLKVTAQQTPAFMEVVGVRNLKVGAVSEISRTNDQNGLEVVLAIDDTRSMAALDSSGTETKIKAATDAAKLLVGDLYAGNDKVDNIYMGILPFSNAVNLPASVQSGSWLNASDPNAGNYKYGTTWGGCFESRSATVASPLDNLITYDISEDKPNSANPFNKYFYPPAAPTYSYGTMTGQGYYGIHNGSTLAPANAGTGASIAYINFNPWGKTADFPGTKWADDTNGYALANVTNLNFLNQPNGAINTPMGPNVYCPPRVWPMMDSAMEINGHIDDVAASAPIGNTMIDLGLAWSWRMLSPEWSGLWNSTAMTTYGLPHPYNITTIHNQKVVILLTDGTNLQLPGFYSAYGFMSENKMNTSDPTDPQVFSLELDRRTRAVCDAMKRKGIIIYTIGFGVPSPDSPPTLPDRQNYSYVDVDLLTYCATAPNYFYLAPTAADLAAAFKSIGQLLQTIRVSQ